MSRPSRKVGIVEAHHAMPTSIQFNQCMLVIDHQSRFIETVFQDGSIAPARPNFEPSDIGRAHVLGYRGDTWAMTLGHESMHTWVAERMGFPYSLILFNVAHGGAKRWPPGGREEEGYVTSWQRFMNTAERDDLVAGFFVRAAEVTGKSERELIAESRSFLERVFQPTFA